MNLPATRKSILHRLELGRISRAEAKREIVASALLWHDVHATAAGVAATAAFAWVTLTLLARWIG